MNKVISKLFFFFFILLTGYVYAGQNSLIINYPASVGTYTKIQLVNQQKAASLCAVQVNGNYVNNGALFTDPSSGNLEICLNGKTVTYPEICFNRFCSYKTPATSCVATCPAGYAQRMINKFNTTGKYYVTSIICCSSGSFMDYVFSF